MKISPNKCSSLKLCQSPLVHQRSRSETAILACVASVSVWFRSKEIPRKGTVGFDRARNETRAKRGRWKGRKETSSPPHRSFTCATFLAVFDSRSSFFSPKPHRNACYAGYSDLRLAFLFFFLPKKQHF